MHTHITQIGIVGGGELGRAIGEAMTAARRQVLYYDKDPERSTTSSIEDIVRTCSVLLLCIPSWAVKDVAKQIHKAARPGGEYVVISLAKGVEPGFITMDHTLHSRLPKFYDYGVLYGPMIAEEIARGRSGTGVLALSNTAWFSSIRSLFDDAHISIESSGDMRGVALCAVLKNIYAIAFGICDGLHLGLNAKGKLAVMALHEMKRIVADRQASPYTAEGIAGLGDMLATGFSDHSFNYRVGKSLAEKIADEHIKSEGLVALYEFSKAADIRHYPLVSVINQIVFHYGEPTQLAELIQRH